MVRVAIRGGGRPEIRRLFETMSHLGRPVQAEGDAGEDKAGRKVHALRRGDLLLVREGRPRRDQPARRDPRRAGRQGAECDRPPDATWRSGRARRDSSRAGWDSPISPGCPRYSQRPSAWDSTASSGWTGLGLRGRRDADCDPRSRPRGAPRRARTDRSADLQCAIPASIPPGCTASSSCRWMYRRLTTRSSSWRRCPAPTEAGRISGP